MKTSIAPQTGNFATQRTHIHLRFEIVLLPIQKWGEEIQKMKLNPFLRKTCDVIDPVINNRAFFIKKNYLRHLQIVQITTCQIESYLITDIYPY